LGAGLAPGVAWRALRPGRTSGSRADREAGGRSAGGAARSHCADSDRSTISSLASSSSTACSSAIGTVLGASSVALASNSIPPTMGASRVAVRSSSMLT